MELAHRSDQELLSDVTKLVGSHREITAKLVAHLAEIEDRRLHLKAGFPSMFAFCVKPLGLGETEAFRRILAARLMRRFPVVYSLLASGRVHLSTLELLRERLTDDNHVELLEAVSGKSKRDVEALLAARFPRADAASRIDRLPDTRMVHTSAEPSTITSFGFQPCGNRLNQKDQRARVEPLSADRYRVEFTASAELREKLELCRDLMSHANPSRDLGKIIERAVELLVADLEKKRLARTKRPPRKRASTLTNEVRVTNATRRRVFERDGLRCTYISPEGRRCEARAFLELDHIQPRALGGADDVGNLRVRCRGHNQLWAEQAFGREHVERRRHFRQRKWEQTDDGSQSESRQGRSETLKARLNETVPSGIFEKVRLALTKLGFRDAQARRAVDEVQRLHEEPPPVQQALREAVLAATARCA